MLAFFTLAVLVNAQQGSAQVQENTKNPKSITNDSLIAIDILLQPGKIMVDKANAINARLRENYPGGYSLDATHAPHITLLQRYVRQKDLGAVSAAITKVLGAERPMELRLTAKSIFYAKWNGVAVTTIIVEKTPALLQLQQKVAAVLSPFSVTGGTASAFIDTPAGAEIIGYVETFVPEASGEKYMPHVTVGVAREEFVKQVKAEPFQAFSFNIEGVAIYQLGNFGTASKMLWKYR